MVYACSDHDLHTWPIAHNWPVYSIDTLSYESASHRRTAALDNMRQLSLRLYEHVVGRTVVPSEERTEPCSLLKLLRRRQWTRPTAVTTHEMCICMYPLRTTIDECMPNMRHHVQARGSEKERDRAWGSALSV